MGSSSSKNPNNNENKPNIETHNLPSKNPVVSCSKNENKPNIETHNLPSKNPVVKEKLSFQNPNNNANAGLIRSNVNDAENQRSQNIFMCPNKHALTCDPTHKCVICEKEMAGLGCQKCKYHICYDCFGINLNEFNSKSRYCLFEHPLTFNTSPDNCIKCLQKFDDGYKCKTCKSFSLCKYCLGFDPNLYKADSSKCFFQHPLEFYTSPISISCIICEEQLSNGLKCSVCRSYFVCLTCSKFKFPINSCPSNQNLNWSPENRRCSRCFSDRFGFECPHCLYRLCTVCKSPAPVKAFDNSLTHLEPMLIIASGSWDNTIKIWDTTPGKSNKNCQNDSPIIECSKLEIQSYVQEKENLEAELYL